VIYPPENFLERLGKRGIAPKQDDNAGDGLHSRKKKIERHALEDRVAAMIVVPVQTQLTTLAKYPTFLVSVALVSILQKNHSTYKAPPGGAFSCAKDPEIHPPSVPAHPGHTHDKGDPHRRPFGQPFLSHGLGEPERKAREEKTAHERSKSSWHQRLNADLKEMAIPYGGKRDERASIKGGGYVAREGVAL
jgi:hypothetical protein